MTAGQLDPFNHAISFVVNCDDQAELDRYWNALLEGGSAEACGWLKDRYGVSWQIIRLLTRLADSGLITVERIGNQKHYQASRASPVFAELHGLIVKTSGLLAPLGAALAPLANRIRAAFVYGSVAKGSDRAASDIDLMVIADKLDYADAFSALQTIEAQLGRTINPNVMTRAEWRRKRAQAGFVSRIASQPRLFVIGSDDDLA